MPYLSGLAVAALMLAGCRAQSGATAETRPIEATVQMSEYTFESPAKLPAGSITFRARNEGGEPHDLTLIRIPASLGISLEDQLRSDRRLAVVPIARIKPRRPGESGFFSVDLEPGRYGIICFVRAGDGVPHARKGMSREFVVQKTTVQQ